MHTKLKDSGRIWLWGFLAVIVMSQLYIVQELLAAFALFALGFATIAFVVASLYMLQHCWELAGVRFADIRTARHERGLSQPRESESGLRSRDSYSRLHMRG